MHISSPQPGFQHQVFDEDLIDSQQHRWNQAFRDMGLAVAQLDLDSTLLSVNHRLAKLIGYQETDLLGGHLFP